MASYHLVRLDSYLPMHCLKKMFLSIINFMITAEILTDSSVNFDYQ